jgi:DNA invertase Pin-like site-specific DNA recombinase
MNVIIYLRVSTATQNTERQKDELVEICKTNGYNIVDIIEETISGKFRWKRNRSN